MKKSIFTTVFTVIVSFAIAQEKVLTNKTHTPILPTEGTWALGIDASPFLNYAGGLIGGDAAVAPSFNGTTFFGKYFLQDNKALRFGATINSWTNSVITFEHKAGSITAEIIENVWKRSSASANFFFGYERRIGTTRLQGFLGTQGNLGIGSAGIKHTYTYGNALSINYTHWDWRPLFEKPGIRFSIGASAFAGVEYFIAQGISLGAQIGYGASFDMNGKRSVEEEMWVFNPWPTQGGRVQKRTVETSSHNAFNFGNFGGGINLIFHLKGTKQNPPGRYDLSQPSTPSREEVRRQQREERRAERRKREQITGPSMDRLDRPVTLPFR